MMTKDEALKMAHKTFMQLNERTPRKEDGSGYFDKEIYACKEALEQPTVAELNNEYLRDTYIEGLNKPAQEPVEYLGALKNSDGSVNLYFKKDQWQELTDDDVHEILGYCVSEQDFIVKAAIYKTEAKLKDKNHG